MPSSKGKKTQNATGRRHSKKSYDTFYKYIREIAAQQGMAITQQAVETVDSMLHQAFVRMMAGADTALSHARKGVTLGYNEAVVGMQMSFPPAMAAFLHKAGTRAVHSYEEAKRR